MKIKKGDQVMVLSGKEKGKTGTVTGIIEDKHQVLVEGVNMVTRHIKNRRVRSQGQVIEKPMPMPAAKVGVVVDGKPVRIGYEFEGEGKDRKKIRVARPTGKKI
jgi:large subunit ribosomal protein L24